MTKLARQSLVMAAVLFLACAAVRLCTGNSYTAYVPINHMYQDSGEFRIEGAGENGGNMTFDEPRREEDYIRFRTYPDARGTVEARVLNEKGEDVSFQLFRVGRFGTIYNYNTGGFTGDSIVMIALTIFFLAESVLMYLAFRRAKGPAFYAYSTIHTAGFSLFLLLTGLLLLIATVRHLMDPGSFPMLGVYHLISSAGYNFMKVTFPLVFAFSLSMTVSNIALLRHERPRFRNVLGILTSFLLVGGIVFSFLIFGADFSGSEKEVRIFQTVQNVYCTAFSYFECMLIGAVICGIKAAKHIPQGAVDYIVILGCGFRKDGTLPPLLRGRVDRAVEFRKEQMEKYGNDPVLVPSGGQGPDEVMAEAEAMHRYLSSRNIPEENILPENQSRNTYQNMEFSKKLIEGRSSDYRAVFSTTNYHVFRSGIWASLAGFKAEGIGSDTKWWFWPNAFMRECVGLLANRWKQEIILLIILVILFGALSMVV